MSRNRSEVADADDRIILVSGFPQKGDYRTLGVAEVDPLETRPIVIHLVQRGLVSIEPVKVMDVSLQAEVRLMLAEMPLQTLVMIPFPPLAELSSHEEHFLAGMAVHITI